ncbi:MAG: PH domain-containing protein [Acutalibacteraceae bacterium]
MSDDKKFILLWQIRCAILSALVFVLLLCFCKRFLFFAVAFLTVAFVFFFFIYIPLYFKKLNVRTTDNKVTIEKGVFLKSKTVMQKSRIIAVAHFASPLQRLFKVQTISLKTSAKAVRILSSEKSVGYEK